MTEILKPRINRFSEIPETLAFLRELPDYDPSIYEHKKSKTTKESSLAVLPELIRGISALTLWDKETLSSFFGDFTTAKELKNSQVLWPVRIAISGTLVTPGGALEILLILGKEESLRRLESGRQRLQQSV